MNLLAVSISSKQEKWPIPSVPFFCYTEEWKPFARFKVESGRTIGNLSTERIKYLADRRNKAVALGLENNPETTHIAMVDSYYVDQEPQLVQLIADYEKCEATIILGASTWQVQKRTVVSKVSFYDGWTTPEARFLLGDYSPQKDSLVRQFKTPIPNLMPVRSVGGCYIFPRKIWDNGVRYGVFNDLHGCEHNYLCESSGLLVYLDFNARLWREPFSYPLSKRMRMSLAPRQRLDKIRRKRRDIAKKR